MLIAALQGERNRMIRAVIFDMDGLMFDTERPSIAYWQEALAEQGFVMTDGMASRIRGRNEEGIEQVLCGLFGPGLNYPRAQAAQRARMARLDGAGLLRAKPGLYELLGWLGQKGIPRAVASSSRRVSVEGHLRTAGVLDAFDAVVTGDDVTRSKPDPEIFLKAAAALGALPGHTLVLEDSPNGVRAGAAGGFMTVMVPDMDPPTPELAALYTAEAGSLHEVLAMLQAGRL